MNEYISFKSIRRLKLISFKQLHKLNLSFTFNLGFTFTNTKKNAPGYRNVMIHSFQGGNIKI